jgi:hypothetical protein
MPPDPPARRAGRAGALALLTGLLLVGLAPAASAHGRGTEATNYDSRITAAPDLPGVRWAIYGGDEFIELENDSTEEVLVYGYDGEPYLRVGPEGVFENRRSPATYLNQEQYGRVDVPAGADPAATPDWVRVSGDTSRAWHDHRIHYMAPTPHPAIAADASEPQLVPGFERWEVPFRHGEDEHVVVGELWWVPGPSPWRWLALALPLTLPALLGLRTSRVGRGSPERPERRLRGLARPAAAVLGVVVAANVARLADDLWAVPLPLSEALFAAVQTALFLAIGAFGALRGWQAGEGAFTALGVGAGAVLIGQGLLALPVLSASQLASLLPDTGVRLIVALSLVQALPVGAVAVLGSRRLLPAAAGAQARAAAEPPGGGTG